MDPNKWDIMGGIRLHDIHGYFRRLMVKSTDPRILGRQMESVMTFTSMLRHRISYVATSDFLCSNIRFPMSRHRLKKVEQRNTNITTSSQHHNTDLVVKRY